jgi:protein involved in polysaccharide export with SLBB domain
MIKSAFAALVISFFAPALFAQQSTTNPSDSQNSNTWDCSDPLLGASPQCSGTGSDSGDSGQMQGGQVRLPGGNGAGNQPQTQTRSVSDSESQNRRTNQQGPTQNQRALPEPLTEFQKFAASTTGQILPIFGVNLFQNAPSTFAPLDMVPVPTDYVIGPGDELRVKLWGQINFQANVRVDRSGEIYIPVSQIGPIHVAGLPYSGLESHLRESIGRVYRNFDIQVDVGQIRAIQIYISGEARRPGLYTVSSLSSLIDALFATGGPSVQGSLRQIELRRGNEVVSKLDLYSFLIRGDKSGDVKLSSGDVIYIPPVGPQAAVVGSVRVPAIYELKPNEPLSDLIADAGGASTVAAEARVSIERIQGHNARQAMEVGYDAQGLATPIAEGDLVRVFSIVPKYQQTVTLRGNVANPGRFAWHAGMHVSDLIPDKESLVTRNYWWKRTQLGLPSPEFEPIPGFGRMRQPADNHPVTLPQQRDSSQPPQFSPNNTFDPNQDQFNSTQNQYPYQSTQQQFNQGQDQSGASPQYDQNGQLINPGEQQGLQGTNGAPNSAYSPNLNAQQRASSTSLAAQQETERSSRFGRGFQKTTISQMAPEIDWDYAVIERMDPETLKTRLVAFDLGKLVLQHDGSQDLELQPGDVVSILSEADIRIPIAQQTKFVRLEGEFVHAGLYSVGPGETLRSLVERAGGLTPNAYLYGSEFTRESTRAVQQSRLDEYVQSLDMRIQRSNLALAASPVSSAQDLASGAQAQASGRELITRLRQIRATGRVVLEFKPNTTGAGGLPDIALEDGDTFIVPHLPASINVVGAVNDQNSFLYARGRRIGTYLQMAGGLTKDAERSRSFIIRADGEVVSYEAAKGLWGNQFNQLPVYPGDTIVFPEKTFKPSALRGFLDWSQVFSQLAIGAATISLLQ